jgi:hypothetical protein
MAGMSSHDQFENSYTAQFEALLSEQGIIVEYRRDRAGIDTGLHLFSSAAEPPASTSSTVGAIGYPFASRVWFQLKGKRASTVTAQEFASSAHISVSVDIDHLKHWFAAPEAIYLVVYVESVDTFIGADVREIVERRWGSGFYPALNAHQGATVTLQVPTNAVIDSARVAAMTTHRSMRIDGPAHRGRPLGHRFDPLRSVLRSPPPEIWLDVISSLLAAHDFIEFTRDEVGELVILHGVLHQTLLWQSPAFTVHGWAPGDLVRHEAPPEYLVGPVCIVLDTATSRRALTNEERTAFGALPHPVSRTHESNRYIDLEADIDGAVTGAAMVAVLFRANDLSSTGGLWRSTASAAAKPHRQIGLEALSYLLLVSTLVYLQHSPDLDWSYVSYLYGPT